ncbi:MAG: Alpha-ketoglutarate-dependent dioxygenase [Pseudomonas sp.]|uniref:DNA oxidative demethylase AlkB n=1 Tax=Pseudomonas sp. TaxID=306 RepID=UPI00260E25CB|nr:DNA oxidative demethylase AlkB [Pseudomonas sp.]MDB6050765.1 Alpha-ketoglutarate-dependent dioxygenase [Pseudomonas sp.]
MLRRMGSEPTTLDMFADEAVQAPRTEQIGPRAFVLRGFALPLIEQVLPALQQVLEQSPFRHMMTPGGFTMSVALSNCGRVGWVTDRSGYRYTRIDPETDAPWPALPDVLLKLAQTAAAESGFPGFTPDACLINRYVPGAKMSLHQDKNEHGYEWPVVSVSLGIPAIFLFGGMERSDKTQRVALFHGDVVVWGGEDRLRYHGVLPIKHAEHPLLGEQRINVTFRKAQ